MIGIEGQFVAKFNIGDLKDFIHQDLLADFRVIEEAGNILPVFEMKFSSLDEEILKYLNEGNVLEVGLGRNLNDLQDIELIITKVEEAKVTNTKRGYIVKGLLNSLEYNVDDQYFSHKGSSVDAMTKMAEKYFKVDSDVTTNDEQVWINPSMSPKKFVTRTWMHSNIPSSFMLVGISADKKIRFRDVEKLRTSEYKWRFTDYIEDIERDINIDKDIHLGTNSGFINSWQGYGKKRPVFDSHLGTQTVIESDVQKILSLSKSPNRKGGLSKRQLMQRVTNDNTHEKYWESYSHNLANLSVLGTNKMTVSQSGFYFDINLFDLVMVKDVPNDDNSEQSLLYTSGLYIVSKVVKAISGNQFLTIIELCRESMNQQSGDFL